MKFNLSISDATAEEIAPILRLIAGGAHAGSISYSPANVAANGGFPTPAANGDADDGEGVGHAPAGNTDNTGRPYDPSIHSDAKTLKNDGTWRLRRGVTKEAIAAADAHWNAIKASQGQPLPGQGMPVGIVPAPPVPGHVPPSPPTGFPQPGQFQPTPFNPGAPPNFPTPGFDPSQPPPFNVGAPQFTPPPPPPPVQQQPAAPAGALDFSTFMKVVGAGMQRRDAAGFPVIHAEYLQAFTNRLAQAIGRPLASITDISGDLGAIQKAAEMLHAEGKWQ